MFRKVRKVALVAFMVTMIFASRAHADTDPYLTDSTGIEGSDVVSEVITSGTPNQVSTIYGNGTTGLLDHPRMPSIDSIGNIYFVDGDQRHAKLRMTDGKSVKTVIDFAKNKIVARNGYIFIAGTAIVNNQVYAASTEAVYRVEGGGITELDRKISTYLKNNGYDYIYRMKKYQNKIYLMLHKKNGSNGFISYDLGTKEIAQVLEDKIYEAPYNFYVDKSGILVSSERGKIYYEQFFPRKSVVAMDTNTGIISDAWFDKDNNLYYCLWKDRVEAYIGMIPEGEGTNNSLNLVVGSRRGFVDGIADEVQMDHPTDFIYDGSGYIFADMGNNSLRKFWTR